MAANPHRKTPLPAHLIRRVSVDAPVDPRTLKKFLVGVQVTPLAEQRIRRALRELGLEHLVPGSDQVLR